MKIKNISIFPNYNKKYSYSYNLVYNIKKQFGINYGKTFKLLNNLGFNKKSELYYNKKKYIFLLNNLMKKKYNVNKLYILKFLYFMIRKQIKSNSNKGLRHLKNLPVHGQRTHTNHDTQKSINRSAILKNLFEPVIIKKNVTSNKIKVNKKLQKKTK